MLTIDVDCGSGDGITCEASDGRMCRFMSTTSVLMDASTGPHITVFRCHLFLDSDGFPERLRELPGGRVLRCRQCFDAEARNTEKERHGMQAKQLVFEGFDAEARNTEKERTS